MNNWDDKRANGLAAAIERALTQRPAGTGTKIEIETNDWQLIIQGLRHRTKTHALQIVVSALAAKAEVSGEQLIELLKEAEEGLRAGVPALSQPLNS